MASGKEREAILQDIARVQAKRNDPLAQAYFDKNFGGMDAYLTSQQGRLDQLPAPMSASAAMANQRSVQSDRSGMMAQDAQRMINRQYEADRQARLMQLQTQRDQQISSLGSMRQDIAGEYAGLRSSAEGQRLELGQQFQGLRGQSDAQAQIAARRLQELMAARGLSAGGENVSAAASLEAQRMGNLTSLDLDESNRMREIADYMNRLSEQEQARYRDIDDRIAGLRDPREIEAMELALDAERNRALQDAYWRQQTADFEREQFGWQQGTDQRNFDYQVGRDTVADDRYAQEMDWQRDWMMDEREWQRNADNPVVQAQMLSNQIAEIQLQYLPEAQKLQLEQLKRQIANIGRTPSRTPEQLEMERINLQRAKIELQQLQEEAAPLDPAAIARKGEIGEPLSVKEQVWLDNWLALQQQQPEQVYQAIIEDLATLPPAEAYGELVNYGQSYIQELGLDRYNKLVTQYKQAAGL